MAAFVPLVVGCGWLVFSYYHKGAEGSLCPFMTLSGMPCPFCGLTHAVFYLFHGQWTKALESNPLVVFSPLVSVYLVIAYDLVCNKSLVSHIVAKAIACRWTKFVLVILLIAVWCYKLLATL